MATEISLIASLLHLRCVDNGIEARQAVESGSYLVREDDVKAVVVKLRAAHDKSRDEMEALRERAEKAEAQLASISGVTLAQLVTNELDACARIARDIAALLVARGKQEGADAAMAVQREIESRRMFKSMGVTP